MLQLYMTELEKDILKELLNIILTKAGDSFAKISKEEVLISVPDLYMADKKSALKEIYRDYNVEVIVQSEIKGDLYAQTLILLSEQQLELLEQVCMKGMVNKKMRESLLLEISNIVTGTLVSYLADMLKINIYGSVPTGPIYKKSVIEEELLLDLDVTRSILLTINTVFKTSKNQLDLPMVLIFDVPNLNKLLELIRDINKEGFRLFKQ